MPLDRRSLLAGLAGSSVLAASARAQHAHHGAPEFSTLQGSRPVELSPEQLRQRTLESPAPAGVAGRWQTRAPLPLPRIAWRAVAIPAGPTLRRAFAERRQLATVLQQLQANVLDHAFLAPAQKRQRAQQTRD
jgi:hypothetical protein